MDCIARLSKMVDIERYTAQILCISSHKYTLLYTTKLNNIKITLTIIQMDRTILLFIRDVLLFECNVTFGCLFISHHASTSRIFHICSAGVQLY